MKETECSGKGGVGYVVDGQGRALVWADFLKSVHEPVVTWGESISGCGNPN